MGRAFLAGVKGSVLRSSEEQPAASSAVPASRAGRRLRADQQATTATNAVAQPVTARRGYRCSSGGLYWGRVLRGDEQSGREPQPAQPPPQEGVFLFRQMVRSRSPRYRTAAATMRVTRRCCTAAVSVQRGSTRLLAALSASRLMVPPLTLILSCGMSKACI